MTATAHAPAAALRPLCECVVVVTPRSFGLQNAGLRAELEAEVADVRYRPGPLSARQLAETVAGADGLIAGRDEITADVFERAPRLRVVARYGVGVDRIDLDAAARHGVVVTTAPGASANAVAELTVALLFAVARPFVRGQELVRNGAWPALQGVELAGRTLGLLGLGRIGSLVAAKGAALGMRVIACDPYAEPSAVERVDLDTLARESDVVSLHAPLTAETARIVDASFLGRMKRGSALVNTARGGLVDERALVAALDAGTIRTAALDVLREEPPPFDHPLLHRDDVLVTPHVAPHTLEASIATGRIALEELLAVLGGREPRYAV